MSAKVKVTVKDHRISKVELLEHNNCRGKPAEVVLERMVEKQSLNVDLVSGATSSSKTILKAIENALTKNAKIECHVLLVADTVLATDTNPCFLLPSGLRSTPSLAALMRGAKSARSWIINRR